MDSKYGPGGNNYTKGYHKDASKGVGQKGRAKISEAAARNINQGDSMNLRQGQGLGQGQGQGQGGMRLPYGGSGSGNGMKPSTVSSTMINDLQKEFFGR